VEILIAEDDATTRMTLKAILNKFGYKVVETCNGNEAWQVLQREDAPRLAIVDWIMPGISGDNLCRKLRELSTLHPIYIILLTAKGIGQMSLQALRLVQMIISGNLSTAKNCMLVSGWGKGL